ncbi:TonB-dependent receptor domain-containing protein [uncultured Megasphaera sp.]|uniref:TonB-dependent receptor domain-containing protein n=1 Tax=uncultured Megasphaera sp. TaxID=165188 RepID=UPI0025F31BF2|nr:TonB-dependent receptor [uncultured Megasphaera sp.]
MRWGKKKGRVAAGFSVSLHAAVYLGLAAGGFFTVFQHYTRQNSVSDVMIYNAADMAGAGGQDASGTDAVSRDGGGEEISSEVASSAPKEAPTSVVTPPSTETPPPGALTYAADSRDVPTAASDDEKGTARKDSDSGQEKRPNQAKTSGQQASGTTTLSSRPGPSGRRAAGPGADQAMAPSGSIHVLDGVANFFDSLKDLLPDKLSEAREAASKEPPIPPVEARQSNTTIITAKEMDEHRDTSVQQALQRVTGVTINEMVPGISSYVKLNGDDRVLILVDGQSLANAQGSGYGRGSVDLTNLPGVGSIDHIEVTKGSGSVRYGSGAVGGVINIVTKKGDRNESTLDAYTGSWGMHGYTLTNSGRSGKTSWLVSGDMERRQYYAFPDGLNTDRSYGDIARKSLSLRLDQELTDDTSLTFKAYHQDYHGHGSTFLGSYSSSLPKALRHERLSGWYLSANKPIEKLINNYSLTYNFKNNQAQPGFFRYFNDYQRTYWTNHYFTRTQGFEWQNNWQVGSHHLTASAEWTEDMGTNYEAHYIDKKRHNLAFYAEDAMTFGKLTVTPGLRLDDNSTYGIHQTPRLAVNYKANDDFNVYASWSRVFSPPRLNDQFYMTTSGGKVTSKGNEDLEPEIGYTQTLGFQYRMGPKTLVEGSVFHSDLNNVIRWNRAVTPREPQNLNEEDKRGFELSLKQTINDKWDYELGYSYIHTKVDTGEGLAYDETYNQPNGYHAGLHYHQGKWQASVDMTAGTGRNDTYYSNNSYVVWNGSASYSPSKDTTIYVKAANMNNASYDLYHNYPAAGRNWQVGIHQKF